MTLQSQQTDAIQVSLPPSASIRALTRRLNECPLSRNDFPKAAGPSFTKSDLRSGDRPDDR